MIKYKDDIYFFFPVAPYLQGAQAHKIYTFHKEKERSMVCASVDEYLRGGGKVTQLPPGPPPDEKEIPVLQERNKTGAYFDDVRWSDDNYGVFYAGRHLLHTEPRRTLKGNGRARGSRGKAEAY